MGKQEGMSNKIKRRVHEVYLKDKKDQKFFVCIFAMLLAYSEIKSFPKACVAQRCGSFTTVRLDWFVHENVLRYPREFLEPALRDQYNVGFTSISPQRFGKPMSRSELRSGRCN